MRCPVWHEPNVAPFSAAGSRTFGLFNVAWIGDRAQIVLLDGISSIFVIREFRESGLIAKGGLHANFRDPPNFAVAWIAQSLLQIAGVRIIRIATGGTILGSAVSVAFAGSHSGFFGSSASTSAQRGALAQKNPRNAIVAYDVYGAGVVSDTLLSSRCATYASRSTRL